MNIFNKIKKKLDDRRKIKRFHENIQRMAEMELCNSPKKQKEVLTRSHCLIHGHQWRTEPNNEEAKPIKQRTYCEHCGKYYSEEIYKQL